MADVATQKRVISPVSKIMHTFIVKCTFMPLKHKVFTAHVTAFDMCITCHRYACMLPIILSPWYTCYKSRFIMSPAHADNTCMHVLLGI